MSTLVFARHLDQVTTHPRVATDCVAAELESIAGNIEVELFLAEVVRSLHAEDEPNTHMSIYGPYYGIRFQTAKRTASRMGLF